MTGKLTVLLGWAVGRALAASRILPLKGNLTLGYYYIEALVGSPPQPQSLIVDTGSYSTIFVCEGCSVCSDRHIDPKFNATASESFAKLRRADKTLGWVCSSDALVESGSECGFYQSYLEGSEYQGFYALDRFTFENETARGPTTYSHVFGCATRETNEFFRQAVNGIIGFGLRPGPSFGPPTVVEAQFLQGRAPSKQFSMCLAHDGGSLRFGEPNAERHLMPGTGQTILPGKLRWSDIYTVGLSGIRVHDAPLSYDFRPMLEDGKAFFDTGTTFVYFSAELFQQWQAGFQLFCARSDKLCGGKSAYQECYDFDASKSSLRDFQLGFPNVTFTFNNQVEYIWFPQDYFFISENSVCIGVKSLKDVILGAIFMRNYDLTFDQSTQRISFIRADCAGTNDVWFNSTAHLYKNLLGQEILVLWLTFFSFLL